jgi:hypothetical protein
MSWNYVHSCAEEVALWTTVLINCWLIATAIAFVIARLRLSQKPFAAQLNHAALWGAMAINVAGYVFSTVGVYESSITPFMKVVLFLALSLAFLFWIFVIRYAWKKKRPFVSS